jgi:uncharacterized protein
MAPKRYGAGQYRYFHAPYPEPIERLKQALYPRLLPIARDWWGKLGRDTPWPDNLDDWLAKCHSAGQTRSTALMLKYGASDWNALHQDLYGELVFPLQVVINLSDPSTDYTGGEFLLVDNGPGRNPVAPQHNCHRGTVSYSPRAIDRCGRRGVGQRHRCAMVCQSSVPANAMPWG